MSPENAPLDFHGETAPLLHPAEFVEEDVYVSDQMRALALAVRQVRELAERALEKAVRCWGAVREQGFPGGSPGD